MTKRGGQKYLWRGNECEAIDFCLGLCNNCIIGNISMLVLSVVEHMMKFDTEGYCLGNGRLVTSVVCPGLVDNSTTENHYRCWLI